MSDGDIFHEFVESDGIGLYILHCSRGGFEGDAVDRG